jgi:hypothetical protein
MEKLKIKDAPGWVKDPTTKAVLNTDKFALEIHKANRRKNILINNMEADLNGVKNEMQNLKSDIKDIKDILLQFINSKTGL